jgi:cell division protein FtsL
MSNKRRNSLDPDMDLIRARATDLILVIAIIAAAVLVYTVAGWIICP